jgi:hypothetical protein
MLRTTPRGVSQVWQGKDLREGVFGSVAMTGLAGEISEVWQRKGLGRKRDPSTPDGPDQVGTRILIGCSLERRT